MLRELGDEAADPRGAPLVRQGFKVCRKKVPRNVD